MNAYQSNKLYFKGGIMKNLLNRCIMETINKTFNVYSFSELSEKAKQVAIDQFRNDEHYPFIRFFARKHRNSA